MKNREMTKLELLRKDKKLTRPQLALLCGLSKDTIQQLEIGMLSFNEMKLSTLFKLCKGLRCKPRDILPIELSRKLK